jgi:hypothetical protein
MHAQSKVKHMLALLVMQIVHSRISVSHTCVRGSCFDIMVVIERICAHTDGTWTTMGLEARRGLYRYFTDTDTVQLRFQAVHIFDHHCCHQ